MARSYVLPFALAALAWHLAHEAHAEMIDFEGLGYSEQAAAGTIGIATFDAEIAVQGSPTFAFSPGDTGLDTPFSNAGNHFITCVGGGWSPGAIKRISVDFAEPVTDLSFRVCDVDAGVPFEVVEQFRASALDAGGTSLEVIVITAPEAGGGNAEVVTIDFGVISGIRRLELQLSNVGSDVDYEGLGCGIDDIQYTVASTAVEQLTWGRVKTLFR